MSDTPKRKPGRPKKTKGEKPQQFSVRLGSISLECLHMLAKMRNESLSQTVAHAVLEMSKGETLDGQPVRDLVLERMELVAAFFINYAEAAGAPGRQVENVLSVIRNNPTAYRALLAPDSIQNEDESYFIRYLKATRAAKPIAKHIWEAVCGPNPRLLDTMYQMCLGARAAGMPVEDLFLKGAGSRGMMAELISSGKRLIGDDDKG